MSSYAARRASLATLFLVALLASCSPATPTVQLVVTGLPPAVDASVRVTGPGGFDQVYTASASVPVAAGAYTATPDPVSVGSATYRARAVTKIVDTGSVTFEVAYDRPDVLLFVDAWWAGDPYVVNAFTDAGYGIVSTNDAGVFDTELASGQHDLAVVLDQSTSNIDVSLAGLEAFLDGGGALIGHSWSAVPAFGDLFGATFTGDTNVTTSLVTADVADPALVAGMTNPIALVNPAGLNPGYVFTTGLAAGAGSTSACTFENGDSCVVVAADGRAVLLGFGGDALPLAEGPTFWRNVTLFALGY